MLNYIPRYFTGRSIFLYFICLIAVSLFFYQFAMNWMWFVFGIVEITCFFYFSNPISLSWSKLKPKTFEKRIFWAALIIRVIWVIFAYFFFTSQTGQPFEFSAADSKAYDGLAIDGARQFMEGNFNIPKIFPALSFSDYGYPTYLSFIYLLTGNSILVARLLKAVWSAWTCVLIYRLASRNFGDNVGKIAAVLCLLWPNFIYYTGLHLKETEMVFLTVLFIEQVDYLIRLPKFNFRYAILPILIGASLFTFRTVLGAAALFALFSTLLLSNSKDLKKGGKRFVLLIWAFIAVSFFLGGRISTDLENTWNNRSTNQSTSMMSRALTEGGNKFADKSSAMIFAPAIFIIPIPTMISIENQENQQLIHGGNFIKDVLAFFFLFAALILIKSKRWREYVLIEAFWVSYIAVIAFSAFAQSERFHQPAMPFFMILAAFGIANVTNKTKKWFNWYLIVLFVIVIGWNWFKLAGRGLT